jgi:hypothetical protein
MKILLALVGGWLAVTTLLSLLSGWFQLMAKFPNRSDEPILRLRWQSGSMRGVNMNRILRLGACPTGLRVGMLPLFGPFCRDFFVPWESIVVTRATMFFFPVAKLQFGKPAVGTLAIGAHVANRLARAVVGHWPETGPIPIETRRHLARRLAKEWAIGTTLAALFFASASVMLAPNGLPIVVAILFPAIVLGFVALVRYVLERA